MKTHLIVPQTASSSLGQDSCMGAITASIPSEMPLVQKIACVADKARFMSPSLLDNMNTNEIVKNNTDENTSKRSPLAVC